MVLVILEPQQLELSESPLEQMRVQVWPEFEQKAIKMGSCILLLDTQDCNWVPVRQWLDHQLEVKLSSTLANILEKPPCYSAPDVLPSMLPRWRRMLPPQPSLVARSLQHFCQDKSLRVALVNFRGVSLTWIFSPFLRNLVNWRCLILGGIRFTCFVNWQNSMAAIRYLVRKHNISDMLVCFCLVATGFSLTGILYVLLLRHWHPSGTQIWIWDPRRYLLDLRPLLFSYHHRSDQMTDDRLCINKSISLDLSCTSGIQRCCSVFKSSEHALHC